MHDLIDFFQTNGTLVIANPVAFGTLAFLFGSGGFVVGRYFLTERIANLESRIARRDDEIEELKSGREAKNVEPSLIPVIGTSLFDGNETTPHLGKWPSNAGQASYQGRHANEPANQLVGRARSFYEIQRGFRGISGQDIEQPAHYPSAG